MSKRVGLIGGSKKGRDHFPTLAEDPVDWIPIGGQTQNPIGVSLTTAARWILRVKTWRVTVPDYHDANSGNDFPGFTFDTDSLENDLWGTLVSSASEADLVRPNVSVTGGIEDCTSDQHQQWSGFLEVGCWTSRLFFNSGQFYPTLTFDILVFAGDPLLGFPGDVEGSGVRILTTWDEALMSSVGTLVFDGVSLPLFSNNPDTTLDDDVTVEAHKFWRYVNSNGDAVYDEDTGDQLADPFS